MKRKFIPILAVAVATATSFIASRPFAAAGAEGEGSPIYDVTIPIGYRQWEVIAPSQEVGLDELRVILGNAISMKAYREGTLPFPDGAMLAKVAWKRVPSPGDDAALGASTAFVPGAATTVQIMVKDSKKFAATGGWGFGRFINGRPVARPSTRHVSLATRPEQKGTTCSLRNTHIEGRPPRSAFEQSASPLG